MIRQFFKMAENRLPGRGRTMQNENIAIREMAEKVLRQNTIVPTVKTSAAKPQFAADGVYNTVDAVVAAAAEGFKALSKISLAQRGEFIEAIREIVRENARELARIEIDETRMGRFENKVAKIILTAEKTPGIEDIRPNAYIGDFGLTVEEHLPFGTALCITPSTAPCTTPIGNAICMIAAGNSVVFSPHPGAIKSTLHAVRLINEAITNAGGPSNIINCMGEISFEQTGSLIAHPDVQIIVATGGPSIVKKVLSSGKKAIAAGAGNPPALVDETADIVDAARCIIAGNYFENGIQCIAEKGIVVVESVADALIDEMVKQGAYLIRGKGEIDRLTDLITDSNGVPKKEFNGKDPSFILNALGIKASPDAKSIIFEADKDHPVFMEEYLMPLLPIVRAANIDEAIKLSIAMEGGRRHTAVIHSKNVTHLSNFVRALGCTIMVKNGPSYAGLGLGGEGTSAVTVAGPTGEGITSPRSFTRMSRCTLVGEFNLRTSSL
jgi:propionaldehyde dehydrogenase